MLVTIKRLDCMRANAVAAAVTALLQGCIAVPIPHDRAISPQFYGRVTDAQTGTPLVDASVTAAVSSSVDREDQLERPKVMVRTDEHGLFAVGVVERANWFVVFLGPAEGSCSGFLFVEHPGYVPGFVRVDEFRGGSDGVCTGFKVERNIALKRR